MWCLKSSCATPLTNVIVDPASLMRTTSFILACKRSGWSFQISLQPHTRTLDLILDDVSHDVMCPFSISGLAARMRSASLMYPLKVSSISCECTGLDFGPMKISKSSGSMTM